MTSEGDGKNQVKAVESKTEPEPAVPHEKHKAEATADKQPELPQNEKRRPRRRSERKRPSSYVDYATLLAQHEEAQKLKKVLDAKVAGTVKWFSLRYHYGFIGRNDGKGDVFVHQMNIAKSRTIKVYLRSLENEEKVEFDVVEGKAGPEAANVSGPGGADVRGFRRGYRGPNRRRRGGERERNEQGRREEDKKDESAAAEADHQPERRPRRRNFNRRRKAAGETVVDDKDSSGAAGNDTNNSNDKAVAKPAAGASTAKKPVADGEVKKPQENAANDKKASGKTESVKKPAATGVTKTAEDNKV